METTGPDMNDEIEGRRLAALRATGILDTPREADFDEVVEVLALVCGVPIAVISLVDAERQWFKAETGLGNSETPLSQSVCTHAIWVEDLFVVPDLSVDPRFAANPVVAGAPGLRFYAGAPLRTADGLPLGTLCLMDLKPRRLSVAHGRLLRLAAKQVMRQIDLRHAWTRERDARVEAEALAAEKARLVRQNDLLAREIDHRVKNSLQLVSGLLGLQARRAGPGVLQDQLFEADRRITAVAAVHDQLHSAVRLDRIDLKNFVGALCAELRETRPANVVVRCEAEAGELDSDRAIALGLLVNELLANAFKHAFPDGRPGTVEVVLVERGDAFVLTVADDGIGTAPGTDPAEGAGLGTRLLEALVKRLGGTIETDTAMPGTRVSVVFPAAAA